MIDTIYYNCVTLWSTSPSVVSIRGARRHRTDIWLLLHDIAFDVTRSTLCSHSGRTLPPFPGQEKQNTLNSRITVATGLCNHGCSRYIATFWGPPTCTTHKCEYVMCKHERVPALDIKYRVSWNKYIMFRTHQLHCLTAEHEEPRGGCAVRLSESFTGPYETVRLFLPHF